MGKKLAIKGHPTRGKEVIELLKMMGGSNKWFYDGSDGFVYFIEKNDKYITFCGKECIKNTGEYIIYELEEFLKEYPFKVGDKVHIYVQNDDIDGRYDIEATEITSMRWNPARCKIAYKMKDINREFYKEEIKCKVDDSDDVHSIFECKTIGQGTYAIKIADGYKFDGIDENGNIIVKSIKHKYPKTYKECCDVLGLNTMDNDAEGYKADLIISFQELLIARDAYWKIAGEEMGLGKPWEPDWLDETTKYGIQVYQNKVIKDNFIRSNCVFVFPTPEMRDAFYKNFEDLIERCKVLFVINTK